MRVTVRFELMSLAALIMVLGSTAANPANSNSASSANSAHADSANYNNSRLHDERIPGSSARKTETVLDFGNCSFQQYQTTDKYNRVITFYLSNLAGDRAVPLVVYIQGSGGGSLFSKKGDILFESINIPNYLDPIKGRARLLVVEKQGVKLFEEPKMWGGAEGCSTEFQRENTLERWTEAINASIKAAQNLPGIAKNKLLVVGHSEGGQVSPHVAFTNPEVTHVASLAGAGPTQLFEMAYFAEKRRPSSDEPPALNDDELAKLQLDPDQAKLQADFDQAVSSQSNGTQSNGTESSETANDRINEVYRTWADIVADPHSITKFWAGHPYNRWYSFCMGSPMDDLLHCKAKVYLVQGTADVSTAPVSFEIVRAELILHKRDFVAERLEGADHGFKIKAKDSAVIKNEMPAVVARIIEWYLGKPDKLGTDSARN
jgi:pimeloyl-ACP methyl ester carboxylesterase